MPPTPPEPPIPVLLDAVAVEEVSEDVGLDVLLLVSSEPSHETATSAAETAARNHVPYRFDFMKAP
jgi:hypothetical protein